jgi:hypothetical protein
VDSTAAASGRRCVPGSGETGTWQRQGATGSAPGEAREGIGWLARLRCLVATRLGSGAHGAVVATAAERLRCPERREGGAR